MKRLAISTIIFCLTITFCISIFFTVTKKGDQMIELLTYSMNQSEELSKEQLIESSEKINKEWNNRSTLFKSVFIHNDFSEIETLLQKLAFYAKQNDIDAFNECCNEAISRLRCALDNEKPKIQNIL